MTSQHTHNRLHRHMIHTLALEIEVEQVLARLLESVSEPPQVETTLRDFHQMVKTQRQVLEARLRTVVGNVPDFDKIMTITPFSSLSESEYLASMALQNLYTVFSQSIMAYTTLQPLTLRFRDSHVAGDENTAVIAQQHVVNYAAALQRINQLVHDVVVWEMDQEGLECKCTCPSCGLGICLCAVASRTRLSNAWTDAGLIVVDQGVTVLPPRSASAASKAGLRAGDIIIAVDGREVDKYGDLQNAVRSHKSGETIELSIHRQSGERVDISVEIP